MAKKSILEREKKRKILVLKYFNKRKNILNKLKLNNYLKEEDIYILNKKLQKLPKNSSLQRLRNRCWKTGKPRGYIKFFGLCRNAFRNLALNCFLPGIIKSSW